MGQTEEHLAQMGVPPDAKHITDYWNKVKLNFWIDHYMVGYTWKLDILESTYLNELYANLPKNRA